MSDHDDSDPGQARPGQAQAGQSNPGQARSGQSLEPRGTHASRGKNRSMSDSVCLRAAGCLSPVLVCFAFGYYIYCYFFLQGRRPHPVYPLKALSHQTSSHEVLLNGLRTGCLPANFEQVQSTGHPSQPMKFVAHS